MILNESQTSATVSAASMVVAAVGSLCGASLPRATVDPRLSQQHQHALPLATDLGEPLQHLRTLHSAPAEDIPGICRALVNLITKHPTSTVWPSTFRAVLQRVPGTSLSTAFCMIDLALQHAPLPLRAAKGARAHDQQRHDQQGCNNDKRYPPVHSAGAESA